MVVIPARINVHFEELIQSEDNLFCFWKGQKEVGENGYEHWQTILYLKNQQRLSYLKRFLPAEAHCEPTRSAAAEIYVWKEDTKVQGSEFEFGERSLNRNSKKDWEKIFDDASKGNLMEIPADIRFRHYSTIDRIRKDNERPISREGIIVNVYYGVTGAGKTHTAFAEAQQTDGDVYIKSGLTKWWDGYRGESKVIIDEFNGKIDITHLLRWFDKYPCTVEIKNSQACLRATRFWITSNKHPDEWYLNDTSVNAEQRLALMRRLNNVRFFGEAFVNN